MKKIVFILIFSCFFCKFVQAFQPCEDVVAAPKVSFSTSYGQLRYVFSKNTQEISQIAELIGHQERGSFATGLATVRVENEYALGTKALPLKQKKGYCVVPEVVDVYVGFSNPTIYISNVLSKNTCQYNLVLFHEKTHQRINKATLEYFIPYFKLAATKFASELKPVFIENLSQIDSVTDNMTQIFTDKFDKLLYLFKKELALEQGKLDNQINYSLEDDLCKKFNEGHLLP